ncbi:hypothetical protein SRABI13_00117 [Erwinia aphidicola]|nr:hypothetical protein SRABI13_00117 [Erwinia aphidicola]
MIRKCYFVTITCSTTAHKLTLLLKMSFSSPGQNRYNN